MGVPYFTYDYNSVGVVATLESVSPSCPFPLTAYQRYLSTGPISFLPVNGNSSLIR